jgi:hypothetical protein
MITPPTLDIPGLDDRRSRRVARIWRMLDRHLSPRFPSDRPWFVALRHLEHQHQCRLLLTELEQWGRCFWFGVPAIMRRKQRRRRRWRAGHSNKKKTRPQTDWHSKEPSREDTLVANFAELAQLDEQDARNRLRNFLTYGVLGLLPRGQRLAVLYARLLSWLHLIKLGHLDGGILWSYVLHLATEYARLLGVQRPSLQVLRAVFNCLPKPHYWHGGKGKAVYGIRQRTMLSLSGRPRLHSCLAGTPDTTQNLAQDRRDGNLPSCAFSNCSRR